MQAVEHSRPLQLVFRGAGALAKADKRGKELSVDACLRGSRCRRLESRLKVVMAEWGAKTAKRLASAYSEVTKAEETTDELVQKVLDKLNADGYSADVVEELTPDIRQAFKDAGIAGLVEVNFEAGEAIIDQVDERAVAYATTHAADLVTNISESTRNDMREIVSTAITEGVSAYNLSREIMESFSFSEGRAETIARTEMAFAHVEGNIAGWRASSVVSGKRWLVAQDNVCPLCAALGGTEVALDDPFVSEDGDEVDGPPLHPNCRCDVVAVLAPIEDQPEGDQT